LKYPDDRFAARQIDRTIALNIHPAGNAAVVEIAQDCRLDESMPRRAEVRTGQAECFAHLIDALLFLGRDHVVGKGCIDHIGYAFDYQLAKLAAVHVVGACNLLGELPGSGPPAAGSPGPAGKIREFCAQRSHAFSRTPHALDRMKLGRWSWPLSATEKMSIL
jgi:hypothetical protein